MLKAVFTKCQAWKLITRQDNPLDEIAWFKEPRGREHVLSFEEEDRLLAALLGPARVVVLLALQTGCRLQSELLPLVWDDLDLDKARLTIPAGHAKAGKPRHLPLSQDMVSALRAMQATATGRYVFPARRGGYYFRFNTHFYAAVRRAGLAGTGVNVHCLRERR